ncbi:hypothetical protein EDF46_2456 [Frondihabitans sp. PhB188]|uniref:hypothetical protein n=1 Tax=Frondihabitans sp. PhB188 TaxID=2485200 RepID=UPI000F4A9114|nr:hypothetical protein [Frondihabitans sp. PhB188]ROQ37012.1 hypothetical protein EDF46_2456 [Frondihabitans sp. PhB188]
MTAPQLDTDFARAIRTELTAIGTKGSRLQRRQRTARTVAWSLGALALAGATTGAAVAIANQPGSTTVTAIGTSVTVTHTGTGTIDLGAVPDRAGVVVIDLTCDNGVGQAFVETTPGDDGNPTAQGIDCRNADHPMHVSDGLLPADGSTSITVKAEPETTWTATARYATSTTSPWGVNANGQTYGTPNGHGYPDLVPLRADNGKLGYALATEAWQLTPASEKLTSITVYEKDGTTVIGTSRVEHATEIPVDPSLIPYGVATEPTGK